MEELSTMEELAPNSPAHSTFSIIEGDKINEASPSTAQSDFLSYHMCLSFYFHS